MCAVNFNTICGYHIDQNDDGFCWIVPLGEWEGGDLEEIIKIEQIIMKNDQQDLDLTIGNFKNWILVCSWNCF